ncbi:hypothetical protein U3516DRAFT_749190 [Neocallimastix sp. 'constans']
MFADGTFYIATVFGYQVFIIRVYAPEKNSLFTTSLFILNNKEQNAIKYNNNIIVTPKILHCDFEKGISNTYLYKYDIQYWNYYNDINQITNNASESFNNYLKKLFYKKPSFYELIYHLKREESLSYNNYKRKIEGESELIDKKYDKNDIIDLWYKCLLELNKL